MSFGDTTIAPGSARVITDLAAALVVALKASGWRVTRIVVAALLAVVLTTATPAQAGPSFEWRINVARHDAGLRMLAKDARLCPFAAWRSRDMGTRDYFSHDIPGRSGQVFAVLDAAGVRYRVAGETIGWTSTTNDAWLLGAFMRSPSHRAVILGRWTGLCAGRFTDAAGKVRVTVLFVK